MGCVVQWSSFWPTALCHAPRLDVIPCGATDVTRLAGLSMADTVCHGLTMADDAPTLPVGADLALHACKEDHMHFSSSHIVPRTEVI